MAIARLSGGPLDGQVVPLEDSTQDTLVLPYSEGQIVYEREGARGKATEIDGPKTVTFVYVEATQAIRLDDD